MASLKDKKTFLRESDVFAADIASAFEPHPDTGDLLRIINETSIKSSLKNLVMGSAMRRPYSSRFNSRVNTLLFEPATEDTAHSLKELVTEIINKGEPRIQLIDTVVNYIEESNAFRIVVVFNMINTKEPVALDFLLYRAR